MDSSNISISYWNYWATVIYIIGMLGYITIDTINYLFESFDESFSRFIYIFLAILFIIDATIYTIDWHIYAVKSRKDNNEPIEYKAELIACLFQNIGSYFYLVSAFLAYNRSEYMGTILLFNLMGIFAFLIESGFTFLGWRITFRRKPLTNPKRGCIPQNVYMWAHILYTIASLIYLCATTLAYRFYINLNIVNVRAVLIIQLLGDLVYLFDACLYYEGWQEDKQEYDRDKEQQNLIALSHLKLFTMDDPNIDVMSEDNE